MQEKFSVQKKTTDRYVKLNDVKHRLESYLSDGLVKEIMANLADNSYVLACKTDKSEVQ